MRHADCTPRLVDVRYFLELLGDEDRCVLDHVRVDLWRVHRIGERPTYTCQDAIVRWCAEKADKATAHEDRVKFQWLDRHLRNRQSHTITRDEIQANGKVKAAEGSRATANRYLALLRAAMRRAAGPWQWIEKALAVTLYPEAKRRVRWLTKEEVVRLLNALPPHQRQLARFALATGLRQATCSICNGLRSISRVAQHGFMPTKPRVARRSVRDESQCPTGSWLRDDGRLPRGGLH